MVFNIGPDQFRKATGPRLLDRHRPKRLRRAVDLHRGTDAGIVERAPGKGLNDVLILTRGRNRLGLEFDLREREGVGVAGCILDHKINPGRGVRHEFVVHAVGREIHREAAGDVALSKRDIHGGIVADRRHTTQVVCNGERHVLDVNASKRRKGQSLLHRGDVSHAVDYIGCGRSGVGGCKVGLLQNG